MVERPDLSQVEPSVRAYIEFLEAELDRFNSRPKAALRVLDPGEDEATQALLKEQLPSEPPTTINIITITAGFVAKRTPRHLYFRQRRGGMGIFDLDSPEEDSPAIIAAADESQSILFFTNQGRAFRLPVGQVSLGDVRSRGQPLAQKLTLLTDERLVAVLPDYPKGAVALVSQRGMVRNLRHHIFGEYMKPGIALMDVRQFGPLVAACRTPGDGDIFIATRLGKAIRFSEKIIPPQGGPGIRLEQGDYPVAVTAVDDDSAVFLVDALGNGTIRLMSGFAPNKAAGGGGKNAMKTDELVSALKVEQDDEIFLLSRLSKIIRFASLEVPIKEGVVQGVHCMALRGDQLVAGLATR